MAQLTAAAFLSTYNSLFADNATRDISESDLRACVTDIKDSFLNKADGGTVTGSVTTGAALRAMGASTAAAGAGVEIDYGSYANEGRIFAYDRTAAAYKDFHIGNRALLITVAGDATLIGTGTGVDWVATSDERLKENIKKIDHDVLEKILKIGAIVCEYDRKDNGKHETGFIAQELLKVAPEYVTVPEKEDEMMAVNYAKMTALLFKGFQQLLER